MSTIGLDKLYRASITEDANGNESYGTPVVLAKAIKADLSIDINEATLYADDGAAEVIKEFKSGKLSLGIDDIGATAASELTGAQIDSNGAIISASENAGKPVAIGFRAMKGNGKYRYFWLYRVIFGIPATNLQTKGDSITFQTPTIEGTVYRRNKLDVQGNHPWKAEISEDDSSVPANVVNSWYDSVYEPSYGIWIATQPRSNTNVVEGEIDDTLTVAATIASGGSPASYQWYSNTINSNTGGTAVSGATSPTFTIPTTLTAGTYYYYCVATSGSKKATSDVARVIVIGEE